MQDESARQRGSWIEKDLKFALLEIRKIKMIDLWNVNKLIGASTKMEVGKSRTKVAQ